MEAPRASPAPQRPFKTRAPRTGTLSRASAPFPRTPRGRGWLKEGLQVRPEARLWPGGRGGRGVGTRPQPPPGAHRGADGVGSNAAPHLRAGRAPPPRSSCGRRSKPPPLSKILDGAWNSGDDKDEDDT